MSRLAKIRGLPCLAVMVVIAGFGIFVRLYLTDEQVRELVIPIATHFLDRTIAIGDITVWNG